MRCCTCIVCIFGMYTVLQLVLRWEKEVTQKTNFYHALGKVEEEKIVWEKYGNKIIIQDDTLCTVAVQAYSNESSYWLSINGEKRTGRSITHFLRPLRHRVEIHGGSTPSQEQHCGSSSVIHVKIINIGC